MLNSQISQRLNEVKEIVAPIEGWLNGEGIENLYTYALKAPTSTIVEIGSWKGKSTSCLALAVKDRGEGKVYAIDTWKGSSEHQEVLKNYAEDQLYREFLENMSRLNLLDVIEPIRMDSIESSRVWPLKQKIGLLYIDGSHEYELVKKDFEFWSPFVAEEGYIIFDDVPSWPGPTRLVGELPKWYKQIDTRGNHSIYQNLY
ncbi:putative O-methyltransferase YrrM [Bacillus fengqiuensis]|nr:putative O-methyltransferase YrrM [Bacillus fengqiuensis]